MPALEAEPAVGITAAAVEPVSENARGLCHRLHPVTIEVTKPPRQGITSSAARPHLFCRCGVTGVQGAQHLPHLLLHTPNEKSGVVGSFVELHLLRDG